MNTTSNLYRKPFFVLALTLSMISFLGGCKSNPFLPTVEQVDLEKYMGTWYEIRRLPNSFEKDLICVTANYSLKDNGNVKVVNRGYNTEKEKWEDAKGFAKVPELENPGELKVFFFWPFGGDYYIMELDENYQYALVGSPSREFLWILSRTPELDSGIVESLLATATDQGFPVDKMEEIPHTCE